MTGFSFNDKVRLAWEAKTKEADRDFGEWVFTFNHKLICFKKSTLIEHSFIFWSYLLSSCSGKVKLVDTNGSKLRYAFLSSYKLSFVFTLFKTGLLKLLAEPKQTIYNRSVSPHSEHTVMCEQDSLKHALIAAREGDLATLSVSTTDQLIF